MTKKLCKLENFHIDGIDIPYPQDSNKIAISLSGGADSTLLAYILCQIPNITDIHCISHTRMWKTRPWQTWDSLRIFSWLEEKFPTIKFTRHSNFIAPELEYGNIGPSLTDEYGKSVSGDNIQIRAYAEYICHWYKINVYYNAVTRNPRNYNLGGMKERDIESTSTNQHLRLKQHMHGYAIHPFRFIEKDWIIKQYIKFNILDLLHITRSCEGQFDSLDYTNYDPGQDVPVCNQCFWCKERALAFKLNGIILEK